MVHNIQVGVNVDEESIKRAVIEGASRQIENAILPSGFRKNSSYPYSNSWSSDFKRMMQDLVSKFLKECKQDIIQTVADAVADKLLKSTTMRKAICDKAVQNAGEQLG